MTEWALLHDAYGSAAVVGDLLERAGSDADAWDELWSRLCHQGTVYSASYAALPRLTELAIRWSGGDFNQALFLATGILASTDGPKPPSTVRSENAEQVRLLRELATRLLPAADDNTDFVYRLQALLATETDSVWSTNLEALADGEFDVACPHCDEQLVFSVDPSASRVAAFDDSSEASRPVSAALPADLAGAEDRAYLLAVAGGRAEVAKEMLDLFGSFPCPFCNQQTSASAALSNAGAQ